MFAILKAQWMKDKRKPFLVILFIGLSILATIIFGDTARYTQSTVAIYSTDENAQEIEKKWERLLNEDSDVNFVITEEKKARQDVSEGKAEVAIRLMENDYRLITASNMPNIQLIEQEIHKKFINEAKIAASTSSMENNVVREEVEEYMEKPPIKVGLESISGGEIPKHDMSLQLLFGFTFFIAMFTIGFKVNAINADKISGVWNRLILSPINKTNMYVGHLLYSFMIGFFQVTVVILIFEYVMGYHIGNLAKILVIAAVYTLSTVSLAMLVSGITKTPEKFNMIYPSIIPMIPVISGVYMPPGTISNPAFIFIGDLFPLSHALDATLGVTLYNAGWSDIALSISLMLLIGVIAMGIGINLVERDTGTGPMSQKPLKKVKG